MFLFPFIKEHQKQEKIQQIPNKNKNKKKEKSNKIKKKNNKTNTNNQNTIITRTKTTNIKQITKKLRTKTAIIQTLIKL